MDSGAVVLSWVRSPVGDAHMRMSTPSSSRPAMKPLAGSLSCASNGGALESPSRRPASRADGGSGGGGTLRSSPEPPQASAAAVGSPSSQSTSSTMSVVQL
jgi:hypothetical protein